MMIIVSFILTKQLHDEKFIFIFTLQKPRFYVFPNFHSYAVARRRVRFKSCFEYISMKPTVFVALNPKIMCFLNLILTNEDIVHFFLMPLLLITSPGLTNFTDPKSFVTFKTNFIPFFQYFIISPQSLPLNSET